MGTHHATNLTFHSATHPVLCKLSCNFFLTQCSDQARNKTSASTTTVRPTQSRVLSLLLERPLISANCRSNPCYFRLTIKHRHNFTFIFEFKTTQQIITLCLTGFLNLPNILYFTVLSTAYRHQGCAILVLLFSVLFNGFRLFARFRPTASCVTQILNTLTQLQFYCRDKTSHCHAIEKLPTRIFHAEAIHTREESNSVLVTTQWNGSREFISCGVKNYFFSTQSRQTLGTIKLVHSVQGVLSIGMK